MKIKIINHWRNSLSRLQNFISICFLAVVFFIPAAYAHHSTLMFDSDNPIELAGTVTEWQYTNPHTFIILSVIDEAGNEVEWTLEGRSPSAIYRLGWTPESLQAGDEIIVTVRPLHSGEPGGNYSNIRWEDGTEIDPTAGRP
tara:strand:- start:17524 stop:17949 length:426 start_codon:yes stop_codon:yes gene_type:complete